MLLRPLQIADGHVDGGMLFRIDADHYPADFLRIQSSVRVWRSGTAYAAAERDPEGCAYTAFRAKVVSALYALQRRKAITRLKSGKYRFPRQQEG